MDTSAAVSPLDKLELIRNEFVSLPSGPPFVKCIIAEWPEDLGRSPGPILSSHPACQSGMGFKSSWLAPSGIVDTGEPLPASPRFSEGWGFTVQWLIDPPDAIGSEEYQGRVMYANRKACEILRGLDLDTWDDPADRYRDLRLAAEIARRMEPRRHHVRTLSETKITRKQGKLLSVPTPKALRTWQDWGSLEPDENCVYRSWTCDDFASSAAAVIQLLLDELSPPDEALATGMGAAAGSAGFFSHSDLCLRYGINDESRREAFRKALNRWRNDNPGSDDYIEDQNPKPNAPRFLYRPAAVETVARNYN